MARGPESGPPSIFIRLVKPTRLTDTLQHEKYSELVARLIDDFQQRCEDFRKHTDIMKLLNDPFQVDHTGAAVENRTYNTMELVDIQHNSDLKRAFSEQDLLSFDIRQLPQSVTGHQEFHCFVW